MNNSTSIRESIWNQFGASLDMLENAIVMCPDEHWDTQIKFWYTSYHCIFWTDYYLTTEPSQFELRHLLHFRNLTQRVKCQIEPIQKQNYFHT